MKNVIKNQYCKDMLIKNTKRANFMNTPFDFMTTPYLYMNACFLKTGVACFLKINVVFTSKREG
jgi:hypothetical protein